MDEQIYSITLPRGRAMAYQYTGPDGCKHRAIVSMFKSKSGKTPPVRREWDMGAGWTPALNRGWKNVLVHVTKAVNAA